MTQLGKSYYVGKKSDLDENTEKNPTKLGKKSVKNTKKNPTYNNTNLIRVTNDQKEKEKDVSFSLSSSQISEYLLEKIKTINPSFKQPNLKIWLRDIDLAIRVDGRTVEELTQCIDWIYSPTGTFWQKHILSGKKLREKYDTMYMQAQSGRGKTIAADIYASGTTPLELLKRAGGAK